MHTLIHMIKTEGNNQQERKKKEAK